MRYYIIVFKNTYDVMEAERKLNELNYNFRIMPTPTTMTMSCGMCIRIEEEKDIYKILGENILNYKNVFLKDGDNYSVVK